MKKVAVHIRLQNEHGTPYGEAVIYLREYSTVVKRQWASLYEAYCDHHHVPRDVWDQWVWRGVEDPTQLEVRPTVVWVYDELYVDEDELE